MTKRSRFIFFVAALVALPIAAYVVAFGALTTAVPPQGGLRSFALTLLFTAGLLVVPYGMIKLLAHAAQILDPREKIPQLKDFPKDQRQLNRSRKEKA